LVNSAYRVTALLVALVAATGAPAFAATTPQPSGAPHPAHTPIIIHLPNVPLHTEVVVEVNKKGQVVRVKSTKPCKVQSFNVQTFGNALQMWIRRIECPTTTTPRRRKSHAAFRSYPPAAVGPTKKAQPT
jgi:hypothetical protein